MSGGQGFTVDPAALQKVASELSTAATQWNTVATAFDDAAFTDASAFGAVDTWAGFSTAWSAELRTTGEAIAELVTRVEQTATIYREAESHTTDHLNGPR